MSNTHWVSRDTRWVSRFANVAAGSATSAHRPSLRRPDATVRVMRGRLLEPLDSLD